jgi:dihydropteroate synthase
MEKTIRLGGSLIGFASPKVMGIVNLTPDSFYPASRAQACSQVAEQVRKHIAQGADIIDIGAYSSRPGADEVTEEQEWQRLLAAMPAIKEACQYVPVSIDTFRTGIAERLYQHIGPFIINDISGGAICPDMPVFAAENGLPYVCMHMRGKPGNMMSGTNYVSLIDECLMYFARFIDTARQVGLADVIIDPGFGFSKTLEQNYQLLANIAKLKALGCPILVGVSRKSMIYKLLQCSPEESLYGTVALQAAAVIAGADIIRAHDSKAASDTVKAAGMLRSFMPQ